VPQFQQSDDAAAPEHADTLVEQSAAESFLEQLIVEQLVEQLVFEPVLQQFIVEFILEQRIVKRRGREPVIVDGEPQRQPVRGFAELAGQQLGADSLERR
jgi:hypothetical protein